MPHQITGPVLITGCSTGIGRATALRLAGRGFDVWATARRPETLTELAAAGCHTMPLDVADESSRVAAIEKIQAEHGHLGALVNNAGYGEYGAVEDVPLDRVREQFETNVFGLARLCQLALPGMRAAGAGRIVNVSSMGGKVTFPYGGFYHASKYAVEALSDALRMETRPFGIQVSIIEPGLIRTQFGDTASGTLDATTDTSSPYAASAQALQKTMTDVYGNKLLSAGPEAVAKTIERALTSSHPRPRYVVTAGARSLMVLRRVLPDRAFDIAVRTQV